MLKESNIFGSNSTNSSPAFGIDLGTTNSCISVLRQGTLPEVIPMRDGSRTLPSCVMYTSKDAKPIVGKEAFVNRHLPNVVYSVKRLMGSGKKVQINCDGKRWMVDPVEVSAEILKELVYQVSDRYKDVKDVVITVPADFNVVQVEDTIKAGKMAGLNVLGILREPTAASLAFDLKDKVNGDILVYDLGGGTFDGSLLSITNKSDSTDSFDIYGFGDDEDSSEPEKTYVVKSTRGDSHLGGDDFDLCMYDILCRKLSEQGIDPKGIPDVYRERLILRLEGLKKTDVTGNYSMTIDYTPKGRNKSDVKTTVSINYKDFFEATRIIFDKSKKLLDDLLKSYTGKLGAIVTVGGSTKNPFIGKLLETTYGVTIFGPDKLNPDESVAMGAAIQARSLKFKDSNISVLDVLSNGIGIYCDNRVMNVIPRDQMVPCSVTRLFSTVVDNQKAIDVKVFSGNSTIPEDCCELGTLVVENTEMGPAGTVGVMVKLAVDSNGLLECSVKVGDNYEVVSLKNVFGTEVAVSDKKSKQCARWTSFADRLDDERKAILLDLVDGFKQGTVSEEKVIDYVRGCRTSTLRHSSQYAEVVYQDKESEN